MIGIDDDALARAARELGTTTKKDTVNAALAFVAERRRRIDAFLDSPHAMGTGPERTHIDDAVTAVRRHRAAHPVPLGLPTIRAATPAPLTAPETIA